MVRVEGHDVALTAARGRLVRFNRAVCVLPDTATSGTSPRVHAIGLRRDGNGALIVDGAKSTILAWDEVDWVSWHPSVSADGRRFKITHTGRSRFGAIDLWNDNRLVERETGRVIGEYANRGLAVIAALRYNQRTA